MISYGKLFVIVVLLGSVGWTALAADAPASEINPASGAIEIAESVWTGEDFNVRFVVNDLAVLSNEPPQVTLLSSDPANDRGPRLSIAPDGDRYVVWYREGEVSRVLLRHRSFASDEWSDEIVASREDEDAAHPTITYDGTATWLAYEARQSGSTTALVALPINDEPDPFGTHVELGSTQRVEDIQLRIRSEAGHLWVTWIDDHTHLAWCEFDASSSTWTLPRFEPYSGVGLKIALGAVRNEVLGE